MWAKLITSVIIILRLVRDALSERISSLNGDYHEKDQEEAEEK